MTNLLDKTNHNQPILGLKATHVVEHSGFKIGFMGFAEPEWLDCLNPEINPDDIQYVDFNQSLREHSKKLKEEDGCDLIIAINHMRVPND